MFLAIPNAMMIGLNSGRFLDGYWAFVITWAYGLFGIIVIGIPAHMLLVRYGYTKFLYYIAVGGVSGIVIGLFFGEDVSHTTFLAFCGLLGAGYGFGFWFIAFVGPKFEKLRRS